MIYFSFFCPISCAPESEWLLLPTRADALWEEPVPFERNRESIYKAGAGVNSAL